MPNEAAKGKQQANGDPAPKPSTGAWGRFQPKLGQDVDSNKGPSKPSLAEPHLCWGPLPGGAGTHAWGGRAQLS